MIVAQDQALYEQFVLSPCFINFFLFPFFPALEHPLSIRDRVLDYSNSYLNPKTSPTNSPQQIAASKIEFTMMQTLILKLTSPQETVDNIRDKDLNDANSYPNISPPKLPNPR